MNLSRLRFSPRGRAMLALTALALFASVGASSLLAARAKEPAKTSTAAAPPAAPALPLTDFNAFRILTERNIFNPNRIGRTRESDGTPAPRVETIAFVGTLETDKGLQAFFDSTDAAYRKTLREGESLGAFKVKKILPDSVELTRDDQITPLRMTQQLRRTDGGEWSVSTREVPRTDAARTPDAAAPVAIPSNASDVLRRLMEQRQKQLKQ